MPTNVKSETFFEIDQMLFNVDKQSSILHTFFLINLLSSTRRINNCFHLENVVQGTANILKR